MNDATISFFTLCGLFLTLTAQAEKVKCLKEMKALILTGEVY